LKREDESRTTETKRFNEKLLKYSNDESSRNRDRILQIHDFSKTSKNSLHALMNLDDDDLFEE
jgi:hypothetical protein